MIAIVMAAGLFSVVLGVWHLGVPRWFDFRRAIGEDGAGAGQLRPYVVGPWRFRTTRRDVLGIAWVMNVAASYVLVSIGVFGLAAGRWVGTEGGRWLALWIAGWWAIRAGMQAAFGRRPIDWLLFAVFASLAAVFVAASLV